MAQFESKYSCGHTVTSEVMPKKYLDQMLALTKRFGRPNHILENPFTSPEAYIRSKQTWAAKNVCKACRPVEDDCECDCGHK